MFCQRTEVKGSCGEGKGKWCVDGDDGGEHKEKRGEKGLVVQDHK